MALPDLHNNSERWKAMVREKENIAVLLETIIYVQMVFYLCKYDSIPANAVLSLQIYYDPFTKCNINFSEM